MIEEIIYICIISLCACIALNFLFFSIWLIIVLFRRKLIIYLMDKKFKEDKK